MVRLPCFSAVPVQRCQVTDTMSDEPPADDPKIIQLDRGDIENAARLLALLADGDAKLVIDTTKIESGKPRPQVLLNRAREILADRKRRHEVFSKAMFGEPAWEMLLLLYILRSGTRQTIGRLGELAGASKSTALRWIEYLEQQRLVRRETHPTDKRAIFVELTEKAIESLEAYLSGTLASDK